MNLNKLTKRRNAENLIKKIPLNYPGDDETFVKASRDPSILVVVGFFCFFQFLIFLDVKNVKNEKHFSQFGQFVRKARAFLKINKIALRDIFKSHLISTVK